MIAYENNEIDNMNKCSNNEGSHANGGLLETSAAWKLLVKSAACAHALRFTSVGTSFKVMHTYWHAPF